MGVSTGCNLTDFDGWHAAFIQGATATFRRSIFADNALFGSSSDEFEGGAVVEAHAGTFSPSLVQLLGCQFYNNSALHATLLADNRGDYVGTLDSGAGTCSDIC